MEKKSDKVSTEVLMLAAHAGIDLDWLA